MRSTDPTDRSGLAARSDEKPFSPSDRRQLSHSQAISVPPSIAIAFVAHPQGAKASLPHSPGAGGGVNAIARRQVRRGLVHVLGAEVL